MEEAVEEEVRITILITSTPRETIIILKISTMMAKKNKRLTFSLKERPKENNLMGMVISVKN